MGAEDSPGMRLGRTALISNVLKPGEHIKCELEMEFWSAGVQRDPVFRIFGKEVTLRVFEVALALMRNGDRSGSR